MHSKTLMNHGAVWPVLIFLALACNACWAHGFLECDPAGHSFTYRSLDTPPEAGPMSHCRWGDGTDIAARMTTEKLGGIDYQTTLSVWVNGAKWIDSAVIDRFRRAEDDYSQTTRIKIDSQGMTVCTARSRDGINRPEIELSYREEGCYTRPAGSYPTDPDRREFPDLDPPPPPPGWSVSHSDDDALCRAMLIKLGATRFGHIDYTKPQTGDLIYPDVKEAQTGRKAAAFNPTRWDIENSGHPMWVTYVSSFMLSHLVYVYYVYDDAALKQLQASALRPEDLAHFATRIFPDSLGYCPSPNLSGRQITAPYCDDSVQDVWDLSITPVTFRGVSYLLLSKDDFVAVVKPLPDNKYEEPCQYRVAEAAH